MKLETLVNSSAAIGKLLTGSLPIDIAWDLKKFVIKTRDELKVFGELRDAKIKELGEEVELKDGKGFQVKKENVEEYQKCLIELLDKDVEITVPVIKVADLLAYKDANGKGIEISTSDFIVLDWLIVE
jgi:hypothetical protein